ncbi:hypothetical protein EYZ11_000688 [Aspergillus tanneri]|uniref:Uncharacterized protein n=1 Tax=Aspergillus tanneri TaxID=1220188 RepID=A0A4S3JWL1_9EURO|nr:hypothetical protein EYZ11_000688 [Aspergillus tanneri]
MRKKTKTLSIISKIAGVDLIPTVDLKIGRVNVSVHSEDENSKVLTAAMEKINREPDGGFQDVPGKRTTQSWSSTQTAIHLSA